LKDGIFYMNRAIELAQNGIGKVSPNPLVGAVIVKNDAIIGEGWHEKFGEAHAEVNAIRNAKIFDFTDCTIFVNLEPCAHKGKTAACVDAIIMGKFKKVVIGMQDPNLLVSGKGIAKLQKAGIEVEIGVLEAECQELNKSFIKYITTLTPYVMIKIAQTLDGFIATNRGSSKWITSEESRKLVHQFRAEYDAILVGSGTVQADNPSLTVRDVEGRQPFRIILDNKLTLPLTIKLFNDEFKANTIVVCEKSLVKTQKAENLRLGLIKVIGVKLNSEGNLDLKETLEILAKDYNIASIMVEGGSKIYSSFLKEQLFDEIKIFVAPKLFGNGMNSFSELNIASVKDAKELKFSKTETIGEDILITAIKI